MLRKVDRPLRRLLPCTCIFCGQNGGEQACCEGCHADLPWIGNPCWRCGRPLSSGANADYCVVCRPLADHSTRSLSAMLYEYPVDRIIAGAKFRQRLDFATALGELLGDYLLGPAGVSGADLPDVIVPVPLHRHRLAARGYNQAAEIAVPVAQRLALPLRVNACKRVRYTVEQTSLTGGDRRRNLDDAFIACGTLAGLRVAIVDDVLTTGTTARAVAATLMAAGASVAQIWTVARTQ